MSSAETVNGPQRYADLVEELRQLTERAEEVKREIAALEPGLMEFMVATHNERLYTPRLTIYLARQVFVGTPRGPAVACHALKSAQMGRFVQERLVDERQLATQLDVEWNPRLNGAITLAEVFRINTRKRNA